MPARNCSFVFVHVCPFGASRVVIPRTHHGVLWEELSARPRFVLVLTIGDYMQYGQMVLKGSEFIIKEDVFFAKLFLSEHDAGTEATEWENGLNHTYGFGMIQIVILMVAWYCV